MFERYQNNCGTCKKNDERAEAFKKSWGCLKNTPYKQDSIPCFNCGGDDENCNKCNGNNRIDVYHCPRKFVTEVHFECVRMASRAKNFNLWPILGGSLDQSRSFMQAFDLIIDEISKIEQEEMRKNASK